MAYAINGQTLPSSDLFEGRLFYDNNAWGTSNGVLGYYDDTNDQWLSMQEFERNLTVGSLSSDAQTVIGGRFNDAKAVFVTGVYLTTYVAATNDGSKYWSITVRSYEPTYTDGSYTDIISAIATNGDTQAEWTDHDGDVSFADQSPANYGLFTVAYAKTSTPGNLSLTIGVKYRYILT